MQNQEIVKNAARTMCAQLEAKGMPVTHSAMLEALAAGLGVDNWRKLKAIIDSPSKDKKSKKKKALAEPGTLQVWSVDAMYLDNNQPYGTSAQGRTALEAAYLVMVERTTDFALELGIFAVNNSIGEPALLPDDIHQYCLSPLEEVLTQVHKCAVARKDLSEVEQDAVEWLGELVADESALALHCEAWLDYECLKSPARSDSGEESNDSSDGELLTATQTLLLVCDALERSCGGILKMENYEPLACYVHQLRAVCEFYSPNINDDVVGLEG